MQYKKIAIGFLVMFSSQTFAGEIHDAVKKRDIGLVKCLIEANPNCVNKTDNHGQTPLLHACYRNNLEMVRLFLQNGAKKSVNKASTKSYTPLYWACSRNNLEMVKLLLDSGAKETINKADKNGETPLYWACHHNNLEIVQLLLLYGAAENINDADACNETPLYWACDHNNLEMVRLLLLHGATVKKNCTPLRHINQDIKDYIKAASNYDKAEPVNEKINAIRDEKENKKLYQFLIRLALCRSIEEVIKSKKRLQKTTFFKLHPKLKQQDKSIMNLEKICKQVKSELHCRKMKGVTNQYFRNKGQEERLMLLQERKMLGEINNNMFKSIFN